MTISPSVHEWAAYAADLKRAGVFERAMRDYFVLEWAPDIDALRILSIAEGNVEWVIQRGYLGHEDQSEPGSSGTGVGAVALNRMNPAFGSGGLGDWQRSLKVAFSWVTAPLGSVAIW